MSKEYYKGIDKIKFDSRLDPNLRATFLFRDFSMTRTEKLAELRESGLEVDAMKNSLKDLRNEMRALNSAIKDGNTEAVSDANSRIASIF